MRLQCSGSRYPLSMPLLACLLVQSLVELGYGALICLLKSLSKRFVSSTYHTQGHTNATNQAVEPDQRGSFSATEASVQSIFELLSYASTAIFARPDQFKIPAAVSATAVVLAGLLYAFFVRQRRGHLFHASKCLKRSGRPTWQPLPQEEDVEMS